MDLAYDHIVEESLPKDDNRSDTAGQSSERKPESTLNEDLQEAYRAFSSSSWGTWLGGTVEKVVKQVRMRNASNNAALHVGQERGGGIWF